MVRGGISEEKKVRRGKVVNHRVLESLDSLL